ncbi:MAG: hypothetical protein CSYNP_00047 [Syntrophus sp. SKADARSKE-3]|nr:hypothetical protein [Syntrophus sp. SKADARSKE-3]
MTEKGFSLIELLLVVSIIGLMFSVALPVSFNMYSNYKASIKAQEIMVYTSGIRREAFLYSERKVLSSKDNVMTVNSEKKNFDNVKVQISSPIEFFRNGTTNGGMIKIVVDDQIYQLNVLPPVGDLALSRGDGS